jgi:hypothetical protein
VKQFNKLSLLIFTPFVQFHLTTYNQAQKRLKSLFHLGAMSAIQVSGELQTYYQRKVAEGKNKMLVLNAVRNKLIHRV